MLEEKIDKYCQMRQHAAPLSKHIAPAISSDAFRLPPRNARQAKRWDSHLSTESRSRTGGYFKASANTSQSQERIKLGVGRPLAANMPWTSLTIGVKDSIGRSTGQADERLDSSHISDQTAYDVTRPSTSELTCQLDNSAYDFGVALNYGHAAGSPQMLRFITEHVQMIHDPAYGDWETCLTCGSTAAIEMVMRMFCDRGDCILVEQHTYPNMLEAIRPLGINVLGIRMDTYGIMPHYLEEALTSFDSTGACRSKPKMLYTIPTGQNPTGTTQSADRRREIYKVAEKHDLMIIEDDPYYFLQLDLRPGEAAQLTPDASLAELPPSYLSLDTSGRVVRLDSTSKILAPGLRCGWITASSQVIAKFQRHSEFSTVSPSGPSQVMLFKLLDEHWGHIGFIRWLIGLSAEYSKRLTTMKAACDRYLRSQKFCQWQLPTAGMFLWIRVDWTQHPTYINEGPAERAKSAYLALEQKVYDRAQSNGVQVSKGSWFDVGDVVGQEMTFRLTFAAAPASLLAPAIERFAKALRDAFHQ